MLSREFPLFFLRVDLMVRYAELRARVGRRQTRSSPSVILLLAVPRRLFCFGSLVVLDVVFRYLSFFLLYINITIGKNRC